MNQTAETCRCGHAKDAHAHWPSGFSPRALTTTVYTYCALCPPGGCRRWHRSWLSLWPRNGG